MNVFDEVLPPHNTPESASDDPFITVLTSTVIGEMEAMQDPDNAFDNWPGGPPPPPHPQQQQQQPPGGLLDDGAGFTGSDRAFMWQQNHYMPDTRVTESGFISGSTTQPPSMTGHDEDMEGNYVGGSGGSITGSSIYNLDSLPQSETSSVHSAQGVPANPEIFIPKLIEGLEDTDQIVVDEVLANMDKFSRKEKFLQAIMRSEQLISSLVRVLNSSSAALSVPPDNADSNPDEFSLTQERAKNASNIMKNMSNTIEGKRVIVMSGGITGLTSFLQCPVDRVMFIAISTLHNLLLVQDEKSPEEQTMLEFAKKAIRAAHGGRALAKLLEREREDKLRTIVIDCLRILATSHAPTKEIILEQNGPGMLVEIMRTHSYKNLLLTTSRLLKVLSVCPRNKLAIIQAGGIDAIAKGLTHESHQIKSHCIWTLRNLSDAANSNIHDLGTLVQTLIQLLDHQDTHIYVCSAGILFNLTCNNSPNKIAVCNANGISALVNVIKKRGSNKELLVPAVCALKHITNGHDRAEAAQAHLLQECNGMQALLGQLEVHLRTSHWPSLKAILGLMRNLAQKPCNQAMLRDQHGVAAVKDVLCITVEKLLGPPLSPIDNVRPEEIVELSLGCLFSMAKDGINRNVMRDPRLFGHLSRLVAGGFGGSPQVVDSLQKLACGTLLELSYEVNWAAMLQRDSATMGAVNALANSRNEKTASFAHGIIQNLSVLPNDQMQNMEPPIMQNQHVTDVFGGPQGPFSPHMQQQQQQQQHMQQQQFRRFQGQPQGMQQQGFNAMGHPQQQGPQMYGQRMGGPPGNAFAGGPPMDQSADFLEMGDFISSPDFPNFGGNQFYDDNMS